MKKIPRRSAPGNERLRPADLAVNDGMSVETFTESLLGRSNPARSADFAALLLREYDPDQPRDELGRWTLADGSGATANDQSAENDAPAGDLNEVAQSKDRADALPDAKALEGLLPQFLDRLKDAAKNTDKVERGGEIIRDTATGKYALIEQVGKSTAGTHTRVFLADNKNKTERGGIPPVSDKSGMVDLAQKSVKLDKSKVIEYGWHTHPHFPNGDAEPSAIDAKEAKSNNLPELVIQAQQNLDGTWDYHFHIADTDGKYYEYKPPAK